MSKNIERRGNTWFATLHVPEDVRHIIGKSKFFKTLKTTDKRIAETRAAPIIASWKAQIQAARGVSDPFLEEALRLRRVIETAPVGADPGQYSKHDLELEAAQQIANQITKEEAERKLFLDIAIGNQTLLSNFYDEWAIRDLTDRGVSISILGLGTLDGSPQAKLTLALLAAISEYERDLISERTKAKLAKLKADGVKLGRPVKATDDTLRQKAEALFAQNMSWRKVAGELGIALSTLQRMMKAGS